MNTATAESEAPWDPGYHPWRHGGWYTSARYPSGACGCVSNNYEDKKWRIACGPYFGLTFSTRGDAAKAEKAVTIALHADNVSATELLDALRGVLRHCVTVDGFPDKDKGRTAEQQAAFDKAKAAIERANFRYC